MFTTTTELSNHRLQGNEHVWSIGGTTPTGCIAGTSLSDDILRIRFTRGEQFNETRYQLTHGGKATLPYHSWMVIKGDEQWPQREEDSSTEATLFSHAQRFAVSATGVRFMHPLAPQERIFGLGERTGSMNKRGQAFPIWNVDPPHNHSDETLTMYTSIPFYIGLQPVSGRTYGVFIDHTGQVDADMGKSDPSYAHLTVQGDSLIAYIFAGPTAADVVRQYTELTGRMPMPARWTLGHHQCRWSYMNEQEVQELATHLRQRHHPCDAIWLDIDYMDGFRNFTWNPDAFPDPAHMINKLHEQGFHLVTILDPGTKLDEEYSVYQEGMHKDYFCRYPDGNVFVGKVWPGASVYPDFSRAEVREWWGNLYKELLDQGVDAIWNDMNEPSLSNFLSAEKNEPSLHGKTMDIEVIHRAGEDQPTGPDGPRTTHQFFHNAYGMQMARSTFEGLARLRPQSRPFVLSRAGTGGIQRYAAVWTGDNSSEWEHIPMAISMCLNLGMSGVPFIGADVGGFQNACNGEMLVRFAQLGALFPFSRNHNCMGNPDQEPWAFGEPYESAYRKAIEERYRLMPHLYTLFHQASIDGSPIMRPLYYHYPQDEQACDTQTAFLIGDALLSAPIYKPGATTRDVYLPTGIWFDYWDGTAYQGITTVTIAAPLERWPLLIRENSIIPTGPIMEYTQQRAADPLTLTCYMTRDGQAHYTLYEDDGETQAHRHGQFAFTAISCHAQHDKVTVHIEEEHTRYQPQREAYEIIVHIDGRTLQQRVQAGQGKIVVQL